MESFLLLATGKPLYTFAERGRSPSIRVRHDPGRDSAQKPERVELVEERLGCGHCTRRRVGKLLKHSLRQLVELLRGKYARHQSDRPRFISAENAAGAHEIEGVLFTDGASQHRHH